jgi:TRAP-type C4-dicarboxylate transport system permease small subunit
MVDDNRHDDGAGDVLDAPPPPETDGGLGGETTPELLPGSEPWRTIFHWLGIGEQIVGALLLVVVLVLVLFQVAQRYLPGGYPATGEVARLAMVWATFLVAGYLTAHDRHIAIHVVDFVLKGRALAAVKLLVNLFVLATCLVLLYATFQLVQEDIGQVTAAAEIPLRFVNSVPMVGFALVIVRAVLAIAVVDIPAILAREEAAA